MALALAPAPLFGPALVGRMGGRADLAGALMLGTTLLSLGLVASRAALAPAALLAAAEAFGVAAIIANALPTVRDALLLPIRMAAVAAVAMALALMAAALPPIGPDALIIALGMLTAGSLSAALVARAYRRDLRAAVAGAGLRDPVLAGVLAYTLGGPEALAVPLLYAVVLSVVAAGALRRG